VTGWTLRLFGRELASLEVHRDAAAPQPPTPTAEHPTPTAGGGASHNFDRRGEVDFEAPMFGFSHVTKHRTHPGTPTSSLQSLPDATTGHESATQHDDRSGR
jgi:hypothetical protein